MIKFISSPFDLEGKLLIVNAISAGYVPTFTLDELIVSNGFNRIAFLDSDYLEPSVGYLPNEIQKGSLGLPGQFYYKDNTVILQIRSTLRFARKRQFCKEIANLVKFYKFNSVIIIGSLPYSVRPDLEIGSKAKNVYYKIKGTHNSNVKIGNELDFVLPIQVLKDEDEEDDIVLHNAGISGSLLKELDNVAILLMFNEKPEDKQTGKYFFKQLPHIIDRKQISRIQ